jgi:NADH dehydrogenase/NADH:ubiquinone oxidoreductase subunit G
MGEEVTLKGFPKLKLRAVREPNVRGAELQGFSVADQLPPVADGSSLIVFGDGLSDAPPDYGSNAGLFLYVGSHMHAAAENATAVLPSATVPEMAGSFTNFEGRVQRFHQALRPPGVARPPWMFLSRLLEMLGETGAVRDVESAFAAMAAATPGMESLTWKSLGLRGELLSETGQPVGAAE